MSRVGQTVKVISPSKHTGQTGLVVKDYEEMLIVVPDDQNYDKCWKTLDKTIDGKCFQVRADSCIETSM